MSARLLLVFSLATAALLPNTVRAMKGFDPDISVYKDPSGSLELAVPKAHDAKARLTVVKAGKKTVHTWDVPLHNNVPSKVVFSKARGLVILLGAAGDPGIGMGDVEIRDVTGKQLAFIPLKDHIPHLEDLSRGFGEKMGNFPWLGEVRVEDKDAVLHIMVCGKVAVAISLTDFKVTISTP